MSTPDVSRAPAIRLRTWRQAVAGLLEPAIRLGGWAAYLTGRDREGVEMVLRGWMLGGAARWRVGRNVRFVGREVYLGPRVALYGNLYLNAGTQGCVRIGSDSHVDQFTVLYGQGGLEIGAEVAIASGVLVYSQSNQDVLGDGTPVVRQPVRYAPVRIEGGAWLGAGACVLPGVVVGASAQVGAGAVVTRDVDAGAIVVGVPARPFR